MRLPRLRLTVRRLMTVIALVAIVFGVSQMWQRRHYYLDKAEERAEFRQLITRSPNDTSYWEERWAGQREGRAASYPWPAGPPFVPAIVRHLDAMEIQFRRAARYPWLSVPPDPLGM